MIASCIHPRLNAFKVFSFLSLKTYLKKRKRKGVNKKSKKSNVHQKLYVIECVGNKNKKQKTKGTLH